MNSNVSLIALYLIVFLLSNGYCLLVRYVIMFTFVTREKDRLKDRDDKWNKVSALAKSNPEVSFVTFMMCKNNNIQYPYSVDTWEPHLTHDIILHVVVQDIPHLRQHTQQL